MNIRPARETDFEPIAELINLFIRGTAIHFGYQPLPADEHLVLWREQRRRYPWLVAEVDGRFAGYAKAGPWRTRDAYAWTAETTVYVHPDHHRRGVGRALYTELLSRLRDAGFHTAIGGITLPNDASVRLHESMGFRPAGVFREVGWKFEAWHDVGFWQLPLMPGGEPAKPLRDAGS